MNVNNFGRNSFVTWTEADLQQERQEMEKEYICVGCGMTYEEDDWWSCHKCNTAICPKCGDEIVTSEEYDKAMKEMYAEES